MTKELDALLCERYPEIFRDRQAPASQTAMCWGFECGDGWFALIDTLCKSLMHDSHQARESYENRLTTRVAIDEGKIRPTDSNFVCLNEYASDAAIATAKEQWEYKKTHLPMALQVKEKFGGLRFYVTDATDAQYVMIGFAESMSYRICENCGTTKDARCWQEGWHRTLCISCAKTEGKLSNTNTLSRD